MARGRFKECRSVSRVLIREDDVLLRRKRVVFGFSVGKGARLARIRAVRAVFGLLYPYQTELE